RAMSRYEMASIVAKAMQKGSNNFGDKAVLDKLSAEYAGELDTLKKRVDAHDKDIQELKEKADRFQLHGLARVQMGNDNGLQSDGCRGDYNNRFYMDLEGSLKINKHATARFSIEKNARYRDKEYVMKDAYAADPSGKLQKIKVPVTGDLRDMPDADTNHSGLISNIWVELQLGPKHDWYTNIGRKWNGIGMQNLLLGGQVDGIQIYHPIEHGHGWWLSAQYWKSSADCSEFDSIFKPIYKKDETGKDVLDHYEQEVTEVRARRAPVCATLDFWGPIGKYVNANVGYTHIVGNKYDKNGGGNGYWYDTTGFVNADISVKPLKDVTLTGSYVHAFTKENGNFGHGDTDWAFKAEYKGTDLNRVGSYGLYAKYVNLGAFADLGHDDEWSTREPTFINGVRGWYFGFKCVPAHNVEWETLWAPHLYENITYSNPVERRILRTWLDFHF
ncbi:MAG: S-layer homology domain-containing protein, partial [Selenomonas sp.]|nr:S-layer homology domain-containing protein [Selenomonas sp.]